MNSTCVQANGVLQQVYSFTDIVHIFVYADRTDINFSSLHCLTCLIVFFSIGKNKWPRKYVHRHKIERGSGKGMKK